jgi:hypothetical protein
MEFLTILLSSLMGILAPAGLVIDTVAEQVIRDQLDSVEELAVRVDNTPSYQLLQGRVDRVRIAGRGLFPLAGVRIDMLELETDAIALNPDRLRQGKPELEQPLNAAIRLRLTQADLDKALTAPEVLEQLRTLGFSLAVPAQAGQSEQYDFINPQIELLDHNRLRFQVFLKERETAKQIHIFAESGFEVVAGHQIQLVNLSVRVNDQPFPDELVQGLSQGIGRRLDLRNLEDRGLIVRLLELKVEDGELAIAAFIHIDPSFISSGN